MLKKFFAHFEEIVGAVVLFIMVSITFVNVITRYVIVYPLSFTEEVTVNLCVARDGGDILGLPPECESSHDLCV